MAKNILKGFILLLSSVLIIGPSDFLEACSWWDPDEDLESVVLIAPETSKMNDFSLFYLSNNLYYDGEGWSGFYDEEGNSVDPYDKANTDEWALYFGKKVNREEVHTFIYSLQENNITEYQQEVSNKSTNTGKYPMLKVGSKKLSPVLTYFQYAHRVNRLCAPTYNSWYEYEEDGESEESEEDNTDATELLNTNNELNELYTKTKDPFLKQRYVFLLQRVNQYNELYSTVIDLFDKEAVKYDQKSSIYLRSMGYKAAALYKQQRYSEANYIYAIIFDRMPGGRTSALWSFHPQEDHDWKSTLALAQTPQDKCAVWLLFGMKADPTKALQEIYQINPAYVPARLLASRAVNQAEANNEGDQRFYYGDVQNMKELKTVLSSYAGNKLSSEPAYWNLMTGYMSYREGNASEASQWLQSGKKYLSKTDTLLRDHYKLTEMLVTMQQNTAVTDKLQKDLAAFLTFDWVGNKSQMRTGAIYQHFMSQLIGRYTAENNDIMVALCSNGYTGAYQNVDFMKRMLKFMQQEHHNELETLLLSKYFVNANNLIEELAIIHLYKYELNEANAEFSRLSQETASLPGNPFNIRINDCHDCDHEMTQKITYSKGSFVKKLIEMEKTAKADPKNNAQTYFLLANAYYNITYYGNNRFVYETPLHTYYDYSADYGQSTGTFDIYNCARAESYYMLAYKYAPNKDFEAKCLFMAAKCEQNAFYNSPQYKSGADGIDFKSGKYFRSLRDRYNDTKYFKEIIRECGYFEEYMRQNPR